MELRMPLITKLTHPSKCDSSTLPIEMKVDVIDNPILESWNFSGKSKVEMWAPPTKA